MKRVFELSQYEVMQTIATRVINDRMPEGHWVASVEFGIDAWNKRLTCTVKVEEKSR